MRADRSGNRQHRCEPWLWPGAWQPAPARPATRLLPLLSLTALTGCASVDGLSTAALPSLPAIPKLELPKAAPPVVGSPTEVYERIGRGAMSCWFGVDGPLKGRYIYDATAEPPHKGGRAEINIRERDDSAESPRSVKAFRIRIEASGTEETVVLAENLKLPEPTGARMKERVAAWSTGEQGCDLDAFKGAWDVAAPAPAADAKDGKDRKAAPAKAKAARHDAQAANKKQ